MRHRNAASSLWLALALSLAVLAVAACGPSRPAQGDDTPPEDAPARPPDTATPATVPAEATPLPAEPLTETDQLDAKGRETRLTPAPPKSLERVPATEPGTVIGEVPADLLAAILDDLADRLGAAPEEIAILRGEAVVWNDGALGCPQPGQFYTQALVNGYWVVLAHGGQEYDYRASDRGTFFLCEQSLPLRIAPPEGGSSPTPNQ